MTQLQVDFDGQPLGGSIAPIGDAPMYHHRAHAVFGSPGILQLDGFYPAAQSVRVHRASVWNGQDVIAIHADSVFRLDIWFGNPAGEGTRSSYSTDNGSGQFDILAGAIAGWRFYPFQSEVIGGRMLFYCSGSEISTGRVARVAVVSATLADLQAGATDPWTLHYVSDEFAATAEGIGGLWMASKSVADAGSRWVVICDYDSDSKTGGQTFVLNVANDGTVGDMVRIANTSGGTNEHYHSGVLLNDGSQHRVVWHIGDGTIRTLHRSIPDIASFAANATEDASSGIGGSYRVKNASSIDWGDPEVAAGPLLTGSTMTSNSRSQNLFPLCVDPRDPSKYLKGGDTDSGLIQRVSLDANGIAVNEMVFNPVSNHIPQESTAQSFYLSTFLCDVTGDRVAAIVSNEFNNGSPAPAFSGIALSTDGGRSFGWAFKGTPSSGVVQNCGVAVLQDGTLITGTVDTTASVRVITPGTEINGRPLFVGFRPANVLPDLDENANDGISASAAPTVTAAHDGGTEKPTPTIVHSQNGYTLERGPADNAGALSLFDSGAPAAGIAASNMVLAVWMRKRTPDDNAEEWRIKDEVRHFLWTAAAWGSSGPLTGIPNIDGDSDDWVRAIMMYDGSGVTGSPGSMQLLLRGNALNASAARCERVFESLVVDHDRPPLPYPDPALSGVSSGKLESLGLGTAWTALVVYQIPEECWDAWTASEDGAWHGPVPILSIADANGGNAITLSGFMDARASGGSGVAMTDANFGWEIADTDSSLATSIADQPMRTGSLIVAISKDGAGDINYVIAGPQGTTAGSRPMSSVVDADAIRFSNVAEDDALEMYVLSARADSEARSGDDLVRVVATLEVGIPDPDESGGPDTSILSSPFPPTIVL